VRKWIGVAMGAALVAGLVGGCSEKAAEGPPAAGGSASDKTPAQSQPDGGKAANSGKLGAAGSPCELPVSFELAPDWKPVAIDDDGALSGLSHGFVPACEIDAKPAGHIGFLRVWTTEKAVGSTREALDKFLARDKGLSNRKYTDTKAGDLPATELAYEQYSPLTEEKRRLRAMAVETPRGMVVLSLGGIDSAGHDEMLPAFNLAKKTMVANS
jgi:Uncharacterised lipoprotein